MAETGMLFNIQHFSIHDGPGIRTTVFLKGCNLRCWWCHNPESLSRLPEVQYVAAKCIGCGECARVCPRGADGVTALFTHDCSACGACAEACYAQARTVTGREYTVQEVMADLLKDMDAYRLSGGGVTFSGGEPLLQPRFLLELLTACRAAGIHTVLETAGSVTWETLEPLLPYLDLIFCDIKTMDAEKHRAATGQPVARILENIDKMSRAGVTLQLRAPVIPGFNNDEASIRAIASFVASLPGGHMLELLPFHGICAGKYAALGREFAGAGISSPSGPQMERLRAAALEAGIKVK